MISAVARSLDALAILAALGGTYLSYQALRASFTVGGCVFAFVFMAAFLAIGWMLRRRAATIRELAPSPLVVVSTLFRTAGKAYATLAAAVGIGGCFFIWLAKGHPLGLVYRVGSILPWTPAEPGFTGGMTFLLAMSTAAFFGVMLSYALAEAVLAAGGATRWPPSRRPGSTSSTPSTRRATAR